MILTSISFSFIPSEIPVEITFSLSTAFQTLGGINMIKNIGQVNARIRDEITNRIE